MPVQEAIPYSEAIGNGVSKSFALGFPCEKKEYLIVKVGDVQTSEWSLSNTTVTFTTAPELNAFIQFKRETKIERTTDYATYNDSLRGEVLNKDFDKVYEILQENKSDTTQYKPDYEYSVALATEAHQIASEAHQIASEAHQIASEAYDLAELTEIEHGGTGARTAEQALENLNAYSKEEVDALVATGGAGSIVPISGGGTGAITAEQARSNLGVLSTIEVAIAIEDSLTPNATETTAGKAKIATTAIAQAGVNDTDFLTAKKLRDALNATGEAPVFACRAWLNMSAVGASVTIRASANIASVVREQTGVYLIKTSVAMPIVDFAVMVGTSYAASLTAPNARGSVTISNVSEDSFRVAFFMTTWALGDPYMLTLGVFC